MAALLVAMAVMAVLMSAALPVWRHEAQREKEEELVFRGQQYVRALRLYQARTQTLPGTVDLLVNGHFLRKKFKDPVTGEDFELIGAAGAAGQAQPGQPQPGQPQPGGRGGPQSGGGQSGGSQSGAAQSGGVGSTSQGPSGGLGGGGGNVVGGIMGVRSKSKDQSIRLYQGRNHYNEWAFIFVSQQPTGPGGRGQPGGPGGRGQPGAPGTGGGPGGRGDGRGGRGDGRGGGPGGFGAPGGLGRGQPVPGGGRGRQ
jgi:type II secretory pathway pseudopilin PulG